MDHRGVLASTMLLGATVLACVMASCSAADPSTVNFGERPRGQTGDLAGGGPASTDGGPTGSSGSPRAEAGTDGGGATITVFDPAKAYNAAGLAVGTSLNVAKHPNQGNPAGVNCMDCHGEAAVAPTPKWGIAGTVYTTAAGTAVVAKAEVRVVDGAGKELALVYSDEKGNFWSDTIVGGLPPGSKVGVRNATVTKLMSTALAPKDSGCQQSLCHVAGSQGRVFLQ